MKDMADQQGARLPLERYAEVVAHLMHFEKADPKEVIERLGIEADVYQSAQKAWTSAIGNELQRGETALALRLGDIFTATRQKLGDEQPELASIGPLASERAEAPALAEREKVAEPVCEVEASPAPVTIAKSETDPSAPSHTAFVPSPVVPAPSNARLPGEMGTEPVPASPAHREDLVPAGMRHMTSLRGTQLTAEVPKAPVLPFAPAAPAPAKPQPPEPPIPEGMRRFTSLTGTQGISDAPSGPLLPFVQPPAPAPSPAAPSLAQVESPLSIEHYTRLHVELAFEPANRLQVLERHGIDEKRLWQLDAYWGPRIKADARLRAVWDSTYSAHQASLVRLQGPRS